jgi:hypothetical protein
MTEELKGGGGSEKSPPLRSVPCLAWRSGEMSPPPHDLAGKPLATW